MGESSVGSKDVWRIEGELVGALLLNGNNFISV